MGSKSLNYHHCCENTAVIGIKELAGLMKTHIQVNLYATFSAHFPPFCGYICLGGKSGPEPSHEPPHVDRNKIYYPECPTGEHCPLPCLGRIDETWRERSGKEQDEEEK